MSSSEMSSPEVSSLEQSSFKQSSEMSTSERSIFEESSSEIASPECSEWFDRDTPDDDGDNELIGMPGIPTSVVDLCPMVKIHSN